MEGKSAAMIVRNERKFLQNIIKDFKPEHGDFRPVEGMMTTAQQINHIALTVKWFKEGAFGKGFDLDFEQLENEVRKPIGFEAALEKLNKTYDEWISLLESKTAEEMAAPMNDNPIMGPLPRISVITANAEHTAHHRGVLSVYLRLLGITPVMVYS
ncbi:DinB family protein [candidate division KSB1 bacterium]